MGPIFLSLNPNILADVYPTHVSVSRRDQFETKVLFITLINMGYQMSGGPTIFSDSSFYQKPPAIVLLHPLFHGNYLCEQMVEKTILHWLVYLV